MADNQRVTAEASIGRFTLGDLAADRYGCQIWRGVDRTLQRKVALWLVPAEADLVTDLEEATRAAATIDDRRIVRVLDVFRHDEHLVVVTEWPEGERLGDHLADPIPAAEAARIAYEVARAVEVAHAHGIAHGHLRPSNVLIGPDGEVRLSGLALDAVLAGIEPIAADDPIAADLHGIGSLLFAGLTGRWPDESEETLEAAPQVAGATPPPSALVAEVPASLDDLCARTVLSITPPRGRERFTSASQVREALGGCLTDMTNAAPDHTARRSAALRATTMAVAVVGVLVLVGVLGWAGLKLVSDRTDLSAADASGTPTAPASQEPSTVPTSVNFRIVSGADFDPLGNGEENPGRVPFAYDGDLNTAWRTVTYYNKGLDKPGVGVLFDLGAPRAIGRVTLDLVGNGTDLQVLTGNTKGADPRDYDLMAQATEAGEHVVLKAAKPVSAQYVVIWMTGLPPVDGGWRGGIRETVVGT